MSDTYAPTTSTFTLLPMAPDPVSTPEPQNGASGSYSKPVSSNWSEQKREATAKLATDRRSAISRARAAVEARGDVRPERQHMTKQERLASATSNGKRETGSNTERRSTVATVAKAMEKVGSGGEGIRIGDKKLREACDRLRSRWPGQSLANIVATAEATEKAFQEDPVAAREMLIARYARRPKEDLPEYRAKEHDNTTRGSFRRAVQFQEDAAELADAESKYGGERLSHLMRYIDSIETGMFEDPHGTSARMATSYGAPAVASQVPHYEQIQEQRQIGKVHEQQERELQAHIVSLITDGHIPHDEDLFMEIAAVLQSPQFQHTTPTDQINQETAIKKTIWRAAQIAQHPAHVRMTPSSKAAPRERDPGTRSISGAGTGGHSPGNSGRRSTREVLRERLANA